MAIGIKIKIGKSSVCK